MLRLQSDTAPNLKAAPFYLIVQRHKTGWFFSERDIAHTNRADTLKAIAGDPANVAMVIGLEAEAHGEGGRWWDATSDLAAELARIAQDDGNPISEALRDFVADNAGLDFVHGLRVADKTFWAA